MNKMLIVVAGPVRSGTQDRAELIQANLHIMEQAALEVYKKGHIPLIGEWLAFPLARAAGSHKVGDEISEAFLYPVAHRLIARCDGVLRLPGASQGADNDVRLARELGLAVYYELAEIPEN